MHTRPCRQFLSEQRSDFIASERISCKYGTGSSHVIFGWHLPPREREKIPRALRFYLGFASPGQRPLAGVKRGALEWSARRVPAYSIPNLKALASPAFSFAQQTHQEILMPAFAGVDFLGFDVRSSMMKSCWPGRRRGSLSTSRSCPSSKSTIAKRPFRWSWCRNWAELGFFGASLEGYGCAGMSQRRLRPE